MTAGQQIQDIPLDPVSVLIFIALDVIEAVLPAVPDPHITLKELETFEQHIVEINFAQRLLVLLVTSQDVSEYLFIAAGRSVGIRIYIIVLDDGKMVGMGTHSELLKNCEVYKEIAYSQLSKEELANA